MNRIWRITAFGTLTLAVAATSVYAAEQSRRTAPRANEIGIWKSYAPHGLRGEFHNYDPIGLIAGALIHTDLLDQLDRSGRRQGLLLQQRNLSRLFRELAQDL